MLTPNLKKLSLRRLSVMAGSALACTSLMMGFTAAGAVHAHPHRTSSAHTSQNVRVFHDDCDEDSCGEFCCEEQHVGKKRHKKQHVEQHVQQHVEQQHVQQQQQQQQQHVEQQQQVEQRVQQQRVITVPAMPPTGSDPGSTRLP